MEALMKCGHVAHSQLTGRDGKPVDPPLPFCFICDCEEVADERPSLEGRQSKCCAKSIVPSRWGLAFFEYRGPGSQAAAAHCRSCGYYEQAHVLTEPPRATRGHTFEPHGPYEYDTHYCGHGGWD